MCGRAQSSSTLRLLIPLSLYCWTTHIGGQRGIRTPGGLLTLVGFQDRCNKPDSTICPYIGEKIPLSVSPLAYPSVRPAHHEQQPAQEWHLRNNESSSPGNALLLQHERRHNPDNHWRAGHA